MATLPELLERDCVVLMESTIPAEITIAEWRRMQARYRVDPRRRRVQGWGR
jgi:hypothetical protein